VAEAVALNLVVALEVLVLAEAELEQILALRLYQELQTQVAEAVALDKAEAEVAQAVIVNLFQILQLEVCLYQCKHTL
jgi:hypothetical protein